MHAYSVNRACLEASLMQWWRDFAETNWHVFWNMTSLHVDDPWWSWIPLGAEVWICEHRWIYNVWLNQQGVIIKHTVQPPSLILFDCFWRFCCLDKHTVWFCIHVFFLSCSKGKFSSWELNFGYTWPVSLDTKLMHIDMFLDVGVTKLMVNWFY